MIPEVSHFHVFLTPKKGAQTKNKGPFSRTHFSKLGLQTSQRAQCDRKKWDHEEPLPILGGAPKAQSPLRPRRCSEYWRGPEGSKLAEDLLCLGAAEDPTIPSSSLGVCHAPLLTCITSSILNRRACVQTSQPWRTCVLSVDVNECRSPPPAPPRPSLWPHGALCCAATDEPNGSSVSCSLLGLPLFHVLAVSLSSTTGRVTSLFELKFSCLWTISASSVRSSACISSMISYTDTSHFVHQ